MPTPNTQTKANANRRPPLVHLATQVFGVPLAIVPEKLEAILSGVGQRLVMDEAALQEMVASGLIRERTEGLTPLGSYAWSDDDDDGYSSSSNSDRPYELTKSGIALIPIKGTLMEQGGWMSALSGCSSYNGITKAVTAAMDDVAVKGVLFNVNSPGGSTHGCFELCDLIHSYRGRKPMYAIAKHLAASAAYALASSADKVFVTLTGAVGSIGVFALHADVSAADEKLGVKYTYIHFGAKKVDGNPHEPISKSALSDIQAEVDREGDMFVSRVARNRGCTEKSILDTKAGILYASGSAPAIPLLADAEATYAEVLSELEKKISSQPVDASVRIIPKTGGAAANLPGSPGSLVTSESSTPTGLEGESNMAAPVTALTLEQKKAARDKMAKARALKQQAEAANADAVAAKAALIAAGETPEEDPEEEEETGTQAAEECDEEETKKAAAAAAARRLAAAPPAPATLGASYYDEVAHLCKLAGMPELAGDYGLKKTPIATIRKELLDKRAEASAATGVSGVFGTISADSLDTIQKRAQGLVAASNGTLTLGKAMEKVLKSDPTLYQAYNDERELAALTNRGVRDYVSQIAPRLEVLGMSGSVGS